MALSETVAQVRTLFSRDEAEEPLITRITPEGYVLRPELPGKYTSGRSATIGVPMETSGSAATLLNSERTNAESESDECSYPDNNPKTAQGLAKTRLDLVPTALITGAAEAFANGAFKYGAFNWRKAKISSSVYYAACLRHLFAWYERSDPMDVAPDSGVHHLKHAIACIGLILDTLNSNKLNDDRPFNHRKQT